MTLLVLIGSLLAVALWEFCRPRRQREFPALRRRLGNIGIWLLNLVLAAFIFAPPDTFRPQLEAALGDRSSRPGRSPIDWLSFVAAFPAARSFALCRASLSARGAVPVALSRTASLRSRCRCHDIGAPSSDRVFDRRGVLLAGGAGARHPRDRRAEPFAGRLRRRRPDARQHQPAGVAGAPIAAGGDHPRLAPRPPLDRISIEANCNFGAVLSIWDRLFGTYTQISRAQRDRLVFGVRELPRRDCLKPSAMLLTPWRLGRAGVQEAA